MSEVNKITHQLFLKINSEIAAKINANYEGIDNKSDLISQDVIQKLVE